MFTGLIEAVGEVADASQTPSGLRLRIRTELAGELAPGDSLAVNGVCLTLVAAGAGHVEADVGPETVRVTTLGLLRVGRSVNLERALRVGDRLGGHFVQGHVDGTGRVARVHGDADAHWLTISFTDAVASHLIPRGSIAVDGISLTIASLRERAFDVMIVPHTWDHTNLSSIGAGDEVNLECDMIGKYVARAVEQALVGRSSRG
jgi:riboflavin synthase